MRAYSTDRHQARGLRWWHVIAQGCDTMKLNAPKTSFVPKRRVITPTGAIEWEELPSLAVQLAQQLESRPTTVEPRRVWADTEPSAFDEFAISAPMPLHEPLEGMGVREVRSDEVFQHFFGTLASR